jgi:hypothetical protein
VYLIQIPGQTDAGILANYLNTPALTLPIAFLMAAASAGIWWLAIRRTFRDRPTAIAGDAGSNTFALRDKAN